MYGGYGMPDLEQDPYYRLLYQEQLRQMNQMYQSPLTQVAADPYGLMALQAGDDGRGRQQSLVARVDRGGGGLREMAQVPSAGSFLLGGARNMMAAMQQQMAGQVMQQHMMPGFAMQPFMQQMMQQGQRDPNSQFVSHSSVMTYDGTGAGPPKVYQASSSTRHAPGGVKETKKLVRDSEAGIEKIAVGHHIQEQSHVITKQRDVRSGDVEENQDFVNLEESEAARFNHEWRQRMSPYSRPQPRGQRHAGAHRAEQHRSQRAGTDGRHYLMDKPEDYTAPQ